VPPRPPTAKPVAWHDRHAQISRQSPGRSSRVLLRRLVAAGTRKDPESRAGRAGRLSAPDGFFPQPKRRKPLSKLESRCQGQQRGGRERLATMFGIIVLASRRRPFCRPPPPDMLPFGFSNSSPLRARDRDNTAKVILKMNWAPAVGVSRVTVPIIERRRLPTASRE
jgi:hypothetical protein